MAFVGLDGADGLHARARCTIPSCCRPTRPSARSRACRPSCTSPRRMESRRRRSREPAESTRPAHDTDSPRRARPPVLHRLRRGQRADRLRSDGAADRLRARSAGHRAEGILRAARAARAPRLARRRRRSPSADLEPLFREKPAIHRFPGSMAQRVHDLAVYVRDHYDGDAARVWTDAADSASCAPTSAALPGFGEMKVKSLGAVLAKRYGVRRRRRARAVASRRSATSTRRRRSSTTRRPSASTRRSGRSSRRDARAALGGRPRRPASEVRQVLDLGRAQRDARGRASTPAPTAGRSTCRCARGCRRPGR